MSRIDDKEIQEYLNTWVGTTAVEPGMVFRALHDLKEARANLRQAVEFLTELRSEYSLESRFERDIDAFLARVKP